MRDTRVRSCAIAGIYHKSALSFHLVCGHGCAPTLLLFSAQKQAWKWELPKSYTCNGIWYNSHDSHLNCVLLCSIGIGQEFVVPREGAIFKALREQRRHSRGQKSRVFLVHRLKDTLLHLRKQMFRYSTSWLLSCCDNSYCKKIEYNGKSGLRQPVIDTLLSFTDSVIISEKQCIDIKRLDIIKI